MSLPLYKELQTKDRTQTPLWHKTSHMGLWFDRFYNAYSDVQAIQPKSNMSKRNKDILIEQENQWLAQFQDKEVGESQALKDKALRQMALAESLKGHMLFASTDWHFVTGMGLSHPIENGMAWHPTLGVPYLTGAAVKGLVRAWLESWDRETDDNEQKQRLLQWFGSDHKDPNAQTNPVQAGSLIFFDAFPVTAPRLGIDIITPHTGKWYADGQTIENAQQDAEKLPADWHDPIPVTFLVVKKTSFQFCIAPRNQRCANNINMQEVMETLKNALEWIGAGAKTAAGYGCFAADKKIQKEMEQERKQQIQKLKDKKDDDAMGETLSPLAYEFYQQEKQLHWQENKDAFWQQGLVETWLAKLEKEPMPDLREKLEALMNTHFKGVMDNPDAVKGQRNKPVYKNRVKKIAHQLIKLREQETL